MAYNPQPAVQYGLFVQAAYTMYNNDPKNLSPPPSVDFPAGYQLTAWVVMQDFFIFGSTGKVFYGFIAHREAAPNSAILAIRGTSNDLEWWDDISSLGMAPFKVPNCGNVGMGWEKIYATMEIIELPSTATAAEAPSSLKNVGSFSEQVAEHMRRYAAALYAAYNSLTHNLPTIQALYTFASPMIGDPQFVGAFNALKLNSWRIINKQDIVGILPPGPFYRQVDAAVPLDSRGKVQQSIGCCHALATYLHLINPAMPLDSGCQPAPPSVGTS
jgi:hypothetical protein